MLDSENLPPRRSTRLRSGTTTSTTSIDPAALSKSNAVTPLRITKSNSKKTLGGVSEDTTLRDISPGSSRRNSPSTFQLRDKLAALENTSKTSPTSPPMGVPKSESTSSVRSFWQSGVEQPTSPDLKKGKEVIDLKNLRSSYVKNNIFLANDMKERESSPKLTMSPSQHRLSTQLDSSAVAAAVPSSPTKIPAPAETTRKEAAKSPGADGTAKPSCLHSTRIKGPRDDSPDPQTRERRKTVTFDEAPVIQEFDRRSSHGTTSSGASTYSTKSDDYEVQALPPRPLPQVPAHDTDRPSSQASTDSGYSDDMEERIRSMMERVILRDTSSPKPKHHSADQEDIFSLYTTVNDTDDSQESSEASAGFSSQTSHETGGTSQGNSQDEDLERHMALAKQGDELLEVIKSRPFSLQGLPELGFGDEAEEESGLGLDHFCSPEPESRPTEPAPPAPVVKARPLPPNPTAEIINLAITPKLDVDASANAPITPPLESSETFPPPQTPQEQILLPPEQLPSTPPASPQKEEEAPSPVVPEREATIRSRGGSKLRVRPSLSRQEAQSLIERRRKSDLPPLPNLREQSVEPEVKVKEEEEDDMGEFGGKVVIPSMPKIDLPMLKIEEMGFEKDSSSAGFGELAVEEMERVIEAQKRGYMMRQHSKVVHASSGDSDNLRASRVQERMANSISVEWHNKRVPQTATRNVAAQARKPSREIPKSNSSAPLPKPGHTRANSKETSKHVEIARPPVPRKTSGEYGRLFIKVVKLKDLELPLSKDEPMHFSCTLDNGLHCVTTPFKLLSQKESKIDQEFELIATDKLEFMLTLQIRINLPPAPAKTKGTLGRATLQKIFGSPKKRPAVPAVPQKDPYHGLGGTIGRDGSFSRSYVALKTYENAAYGRQFTTDIACLNEWALEPGAVVQRRGVEVQRMRKRPYLVGKIECQFLFVPCCFAGEELPKSMSAAVREMKNAEWFGQLLWEGYLSQQGGDCQHWRRRYFKLVGSSLIGFHESSRARRATINLAKSTRVVDDRESLIETPPVKARGQRRKSAFINETEGYMYLEEGFRIWFANGEVIDFRADTKEEKREWVNVLQGVVGKVPARKEWADAVLARERAMKK